MYKVGKWCGLSLGWPKDSQLKMIYKLVDAFNNNEFEFVDRNCNLCGGNIFLTIGEYDRYGIPCRSAICKACGLIQITPYLTSEGCTKFYNEYFAIIGGASLLSWDTAFEKQYEHGKKHFDYLVKQRLVFNCKSPPHILEVGCSTGGALAYFKEVKDATIKGVDLNKSFIDKSIEIKGLDLEVGSIFDVKFDPKADIIIYNHVLEHLLDPIKELTYLRENVLNKGGILYITVPCVNSLLRKPPFPFESAILFAHPMLYSPITLSAILIKSGFSVYSLVVSKDIKIIAYKSTDVVQSIFNKIYFLKQQGEGKSNENS